MNDSLKNGVSIYDVSDFVKDKTTTMIIFVDSFKDTHLPLMTRQTNVKKYSIYRNHASNFLKGKTATFFTCRYF